MHECEGLACTILLALHQKLSIDTTVRSSCPMLLVLRGANRSVRLLQTLKRNQTRPSGLSNEDSAPLPMRPLHVATRGHALRAQPPPWERWAI